MLTLTRDISFQSPQVVCRHHQPQPSEWTGHWRQCNDNNVKMSICSNARWRQTDRHATSLFNVFLEAGPSPNGAVIYLSMWSVLRGEERKDGRGFALPEGAGLLLRDRKYNWAALTPGYSTNQTFLPPSLSHPPTLLADIVEQMRQCWPFRPWAETIPNKTCHLCLQWHLFDRRIFFILSLPPAFYSVSASLCGLSCNTGNLNAAWLGLPVTTAVQGKWLCCEGQATC